MQEDRSSLALGNYEDMREALTKKRSQSSKEKEQVFESLKKLGQFVDALFDVPNQTQLAPQLTELRTAIWLQLLLPIDAMQIIFAKRENFDLPKRRWWFLDKNAKFCYRPLGEVAWVVVNDYLRKSAIQFGSIAYNDLKARGFYSEPLFPSLAKLSKGDAKSVIKREMTQFGTVRNLVFKA